MRPENSGAPGFSLHQNRPRRGEANIFAVSQSRGAADIALLRAARRGIALNRPFNEGRLSTPSVKMRSAGRNDAVEAAAWRQLKYLVVSPAMSPLK